MAKAQKKQTKGKIRILKNLGFGFICIVLGYVLMGNLAANNSTIYGISHYMNVVVLTGSMEPEIKPGDYITVVKKNKDKYKIGDVVTYLRTTDSGDKEKVTHQIISIKGEEVITKGISSGNNNADTPITKDDILGQHILTIPKLGYVMQFLSSPMGIILIVGFILAVIFWEITEPKKEEKKKAVVENIPNTKHSVIVNKDEENIAERISKPKVQPLFEKEKKIEYVIDDNDDKIDLISEISKLREEKKKILEAEKLLDEARKKETEKTRKNENTYEKSLSEKIVSKPKDERVLKLVKTLAGINITSENIAKATGIALEKVNKLKEMDKIITIAKNLLDMKLSIEQVKLATRLSDEKIQEIISQKEAPSFDEVWEDERIIEIARRLIDRNISLDKISNSIGLELTKVKIIEEQYKIILIVRNLYSMGMSYEDIGKATTLSIDKVKSYVSDEIFNHEEYEENTVADVVKNLLTIEMPMSDIIRATSLTIEEIKTIREDIEMEAIAKNLLDMKIATKHIVEATGLTMNRIMKLKGNEYIIEIARNLLQIGLKEEDVSEIVRLPLDVISIIEKNDLLRKTDVISIDFGAIN